MKSESIVIPSTNLSLAWADALSRVHAAPSGVLPHPLVISIEEFDGHGDPIQVPEVRVAVDQAIDAVNIAAGKRRIQTVDATAGSIFPRMCWSPMLPRPAEQLFEHYRTKVFPRLRRLSPLNRRGTYFLRMIDSTGLKRTSRRLVPHTVNQLADILVWCRRAERNNRHMRSSALQASVYDPAKDHNGAARAYFPCLQQVSFGYSRDGLDVSAYYPAEYIFDRGYGNYLGLCHLGGFMAHELKVRLHRVTVFINLPELGSPQKKDIKALVNCVRGHMGGIASAGSIA